MTIEYLNSDYLSPGTKFRTRSGEDLRLEAVAAKLLAESREGVTALSEKRDFLTRDQLELRWQKEVLNQNGVPDESLMHGVYGRKYNPLFGTRPGSVRGRSEE